MTDVNASRIYVLFPWFEEHGFNHIHPSDHEVFRTNHPYGKVFVRAETKDGWVLLQYGQESLRVLPDLIQEISIENDWGFHIGDEVVLIVNEKAAIIRSVTWNQKRSEPMFGIEVEGKIRSKRYWTEDLKPEDNSENT